VNKYAVHEWDECPNCKKSAGLPFQCGDWQVCNMETHKCVKCRAQLKVDVESSGCSEDFSEGSYPIVTLSAVGWASEDAPDDGSMAAFLLSQLNGLSRIGE
jgi:hypothetical protein